MPMSPTASRYCLEAQLPRYGDAAKTESAASTACERVPAPAIASVVRCWLAEHTEIEADDTEGVAIGAVGVAEQLVSWTVRPPLLSRCDGRRAGLRVGLSPGAAGGAATSTLGRRLALLCAELVEPAIFSSTES